MNAQDYIKSHSKSYLAKALAKVAPNAKIVLGSGTITENPNSNLQRTLKEHKSDEFVQGGRAGRNRNDGHHFAVILKK